MGKINMKNKIMIEQIMDRNQLEKCGFLPVEYEGQEGVFMSKTLIASNMPNFLKEVVDDDVVFNTDEVIVEVCPNNTVHLLCLNADYIQEAVPVDCEEGRALLTDAGYQFLDIHCKFKI